MHFFIAIFWAALVSVALAPLPATSVQIISDQTNFNLINGNLRAERVVTVLCPAASWGPQFNQTLQLTSPRNKTESVSFVCGTYRTDYQGALAGYVPPRGRLYESQVCAKRDSRQTADELKKMRYSIFNFSRAQIDDEPGLQRYALASRKMRLQAVHSAVRAHGLSATRAQIRSFEYSPNPVSPRDFVTGSPYNRKNLLRRNLIGAIPKYGGVINAAIDFFGGGGDNELNEAIKRLETRQNTIEDAYKKLDGRMDDYQNALQNVQRDLVAYTGATETLITGVAAQANIAQETADTVGTQVVALREEVTRSNEIQQRMINSLRDTTTVLAGQVDAVYSTVNDINDAVGRLSAGVDVEFRNVYGAIRNSTLRSHNALNEVYDVINTNMLQVDDSVRRVVRSVAATQTAMAAGIEDVPVMRALVSVVHSRFVELLDSGTDMIPMLPEFGTPPDPFALMPDDVGTPMNDIEIIDVFLTPLAAPTTLVHQRLVLRCNVYFLMELATPITGWRDVFEAIGTSKCTNATNGAEQLRTCMCSVETITTSCTQSSIGARVSFMESPGVNGLGGTLCLSGVVPAPVTKFYSTTSGLSNAIGETCAMGSSYPGARIRVGSTLRKQMGFATAVGSACSMDFTSVREAIVPGMSLPFRIMQHLQYALHTGITFANIYRPLVDGEMPSGLTYRTTPVSKVDGRNARCVTTSFMAYDIEPSRMLPVVNYKAVSEGARASVWLNGEEYSATTTTIASLGLADPPSSFVSIGNPSNPNTIVDVPQHMLPLSTNPFARENSPLYAMFPTREANFTEWSRANGIEQFDAYAGSVVVSNLTRPVDPVSGRCISTPSAPYGLSQAGSVCEMREFGRFTATPSTAGPHDVSYTPNGAGAAYIATFRVPIGDLVGILYSACPAFSSAPLSPDITRVTLTNGGRNPITVQLQMSGRCVRDERITILPAEPFVVDIRDCPNPAYGGNDTLMRVFDLDDRLCEGFPRSIVVSRSEFVSTYGTVDAEFVSKVSRNVQYDIQEFVTAQQEALVLMLSGVFNAFGQLAVANDLILPGVELEIFQGIFNLSSGLSVKIDRDIKLFNASRFKSEDELNRLDLERVSLLNESNARWDSIATKLLITQQQAEEARRATATNIGTAQAARMALNESSRILVEAQALLNNATRMLWIAQQDFNRETIATFESLLGSEDGWGAFLMMLLVVFLLILALYCTCKFMSCRCCSGKTKVGNKWRGPDPDETEMDEWD